MTDDPLPLPPGLPKALPPVLGGGVVSSSVVVDPGGGGGTNVGVLSTSGS